MKKLGSILVIVVIIAGGWFYLANKFEQMATEELLPRIESNNSMMAADLNSVVIEKFKFRLTLQDVTIFPASKYFKTKSDKIILSYNPLTDNICAWFNGEKLSIGTGSTEVYIPSPDQTIKFNRSILKDGFKNTDLKITSKELSIYLASDDKFISRTADSKFTISNSLNSDEVYSIDLGIDLNSMEINPESEYFMHLLETLMPEITKEKLFLGKNDLQIANYYYKVAEKTGPINYSTNYSIKLGKKHVDNIIASVRGEKSPLDIYNEFSFTKDKYSLEAKETIGNSALNDSSYFSFSGDGNKVIISTNAYLKRSYNEEQQNLVTAITNILLKDIAEQTLNNLNISLDVTDKDFQKLSEYLTNIEKIFLDFNVNYDIASSNFDHSLSVGINDFSTLISGSVESKIYNGKVDISTPSILINTVSDTYQEAIQPFLKKVSDKTSALNIDSLDQVMSNIKDNGFNTLAAFHEEDELKENDKLVANITLNPKGFNFKINEKTLFEFLADERIVKFLKNMPEEEGQDS